MGNGQRAAAKRLLFSFAWLIGHCALLSSAVLAADSTETAASHYQSGLAYERLGRLQEAYTQLQLACVLDANDARIALALGVVALRLGRDQAAQRSLEQSIALDANSAASYYPLALLYEKQKNIDRAIDSWNRFLEINPDEMLKLEARKHIHYLETARGDPAS